MISKVVDIINSRLKGVSAQEVFFGIAETILRVQGSETQKMPGVVHPDGEITFVGIDDIKTIIAYHKLNSINITQLTNGIGDSFGDIKNTYLCSLYVYWDASKVKLSSDQMLMLMQSRLPVGIKGITDIKTAIIKLTSAVINTYEIYTQEYVAEDLRPLPENKLIIKINYSLELNFKPECFRQCPECS